MNYAWSNPVTGLREQTPRAKDSNDRNELERLRQLAERQVWDELQQAADIPPDFRWEYHRQMIAGKVDLEGDHVDMEIGIGPDWGVTEFAWCSPVTGKRCRDDQWPSHIKAQIEELQAGGRDSISEVVIYLQIETHRIAKGDPEPPLPEPPAADPAPRPAGRLRELYHQVGDYQPIADEQVIGQATAYALLDIALTLRRIADDGVPMDLFTVRRRRGSLLSRIKTWFCGDPEEQPGAAGVREPAPDRMNIDADFDPGPELPAEPPADPCTCPGNGLRPNGGFCSCQQGRALMRQNAVQNRMRPNE